MLESAIAQEIASIEQIVPKSNYEFYQPITKKQDEYRKVHLVQVYDHMISVGEIKFGDNYGENRKLEFYCENANNEELSNLFAKLVRN